MNPSGKYLPEFIGMLKRYSNRFAEIMGEQGMRAEPAMRFIRGFCARLHAELAAIGDDPDARPRTVYRILCGALAELNAWQTPPERDAAPPPYTPDDPDAWLEPFGKLCLEKLSAYVPEKPLVVSGEVHDGILFFDIPGDIVSSLDRVCLEVWLSEDINRVLVEGRLLAGPPDEIRDLVRLALPGLPLRRVDNPDGLPSARLEIEMDNVMWESVRSARRLAVAYFPEPPADARVLAASCKLLCHPPVPRI